MRTISVLVVVIMAAGLVPATAQRGGAAEVRLSLTIADRSLEADYRIESDGLGAYVDGQQGVAARLDGYGNLIVDFQSTRKGAVRRVSFDYACPFGAEPNCGPSPADPPSGPHDRSYISTACPDGAVCPHIQQMTAGSSQCMQLNWQFVDGQERSWRNGFHRTRDLPGQEGTAFAVVTRMDADTWTVEPSAHPCQGTNAPGVAGTFLVEKVKNQWAYTDYGQFWLPFRLTLSRM